MICQLKFHAYIIRLAFFFRLPSPERQKSPPRPPSILKKRPMAALRNEKKTDKPALEFRIIVSNLRNSVTGGDIEVSVQLENRSLNYQWSEIME